MRAWCAAVRDEGDWKEALRVYKEAAQLVSSPIWRGDFLDGAAFAAARIGGQDGAKRLEVAYRQAPSLVRLLRWLATDDANAEALRRRALPMLGADAPKSPRLAGVLQLVAGDVQSASALLATAQGLGWSDPDHPGHVLFPAFAKLLGATTNQTLHLVNAAGLFDGVAHAFGADTAEPTLPAPSLAEILQRASVADILTAADRATMRDAMRVAAIARVDGVLGEKRRRQYEHAAALVGCCAVLDNKLGSCGGRSVDWLAALQKRTARFPAFQTALSAALGERAAGA